MPAETSQRGSLFLESELMGRPLRTAIAAWVVAILAAVAGALLPPEDLRAALALFAFAVALGLFVAVVLVADGLRQRRTRRRGIVARSVLARLDYIPPVTTATRRIHWRGTPYRMRPAASRGRAGLEELVLQGRAQAPASQTQELAATVSTATAAATGRAG